MGEVIVRQWGPDCYAAYVARSGAYPEFVGVESSRTNAEELARNRCDTTVSGDLERLSVGEWSEEKRRAEVRKHPARPAPDDAGATP